MLFDPHKLGIHRFLQYIPLNQLLDSPFQNRIRHAVNIADIREIAKARAHRMVFGYLDGGADDEITLRRNKDAYTSIDMHYQVLSGIKPPLDLSTNVLGKRIEVPFFGCPAAGNKMFHWKGEEAVADAAETFGTMYALSSLATTSMTDISQIHSGPKIFQLYLFKDRELNRDLLAQARENGFDEAALALTVDVARMGNRERDVRNQFTIPPNYSMQQTIQALLRPAWTFDFLSKPPYTYACINRDVPAQALATFINESLMFDFSWKNIEWILGEWTCGPTVLKGVVRPEDASRAVELGFSAIWVSNHGGRQLDTAPATIDVLPSIRDAVGPSVDVIVDGGIQRGTDIAKALALGADAVGVGKPYLWGLSAGGTEGVQKVFSILKAELDRAMGLLGTPTVSDLKNKGRSLVVQRQSSVRDYPNSRRGVI